MVLSKRQLIVRKRNYFIVLLLEIANNYVIKSLMCLWEAC